MNYSILFLDPSFLLELSALIMLFGCMLKLAFSPKPLETVRIGEVRYSGLQKTKFTFPYFAKYRRKAMPVFINQLF